MVFIHGWPLNADMWEYRMIPRCEAGFRGVACDRRGFGRSDQPGGGYDCDTLAADLHALLDHLDLRGVVLVGFSMGGGEVARYLARHGAGRVGAAALVASVVPMLLRTADHPQGVDPATFEEMLDGLRADRPHFLAGLATKFLGLGPLNHALSSEMLAWTLGMASKPPRLPRSPACAAFRPPISAPSCVPSPRPPW